MQDGFRSMDDASDADARKAYRRQRLIAGTLIIVGLCTATPGLVLAIIAGHNSTERLISVPLCIVGIICSVVGTRKLDAARRLVVEQIGRPE